MNGATNYPLPERGARSSEVPIYPVLNVRETAAFLRVSEPTVRELIREGRLRSFRCGRAIRVSRDALTQFVQGAE